jgi:DNA-binding NarL/FixJ family response regulator
MDNVERTRVHWVEEQPIYHKLYQVIFSPACPVEVIGTSDFGNFSGLAADLTSRPADILIVGCKNLTLALLHEIDQIQASFPSTGIIMLAAAVRYEDLNFLHTHLGNKNPFALFLKKSLTCSEQYYSIISLVKMGQVVIDPSLTRMVSTPKDKAAIAGGLTTREMEILNLIAKGLTNVAIGEDLCIEVKTVRHHINNIYSKLLISGQFDRRHPRVSAANSYLKLTGQLTLKEGVLE